MSIIGRRRFISAVSATAATTAFAPLLRLQANTAAAEHRPCLVNGSSHGFGNLEARLPVNASELTDTVVGNLSNTALLRLPPGFSYRAISMTGQLMGDGALVPACHDGMACFPAPGGHYRLVRNHELNFAENHYGNSAGCMAANGNLYDPFLKNRKLGGGGTSTLILNHQGELKNHYVSLAGTLRNCAGGATPWGSWISCEETVDTPQYSSRLARKHGYAFEVPAALGVAVEPVPLIAMGRFNHEAIACDPHSGHIYQTEDRADGLFYRFVPAAGRPTRFGDLQKGGLLYAMSIDLTATAICDGATLHRINDSVDTRRGTKSFLGQPLPVEWVPIEDVDPDQDTVRSEGQSKGAALFSRGEGAWYGNGLVYFSATSGGDDGVGQIWGYCPRQETVTLLVESVSGGLLQNPDNLCVAADGTLYVCEDGFGEQSLVGVDRWGRLFAFAVNNYNQSEFTGVCLSHDSRFMFMNIQTFGVTLVIWRDDYSPIARQYRKSA